MKKIVKWVENDLPGNLQSSYFACAEVYGWQTIPQWPRRSRRKVFANVQDPKIRKIRGFLCKTHLHFLLLIPRGGLSSLGISSGPTLGGRVVTLHFGHRVSCHGFLEAVRILTGLRLNPGSKGGSKMIGIGGH